MQLKGFTIERKRKRGEEDDGAGSNPFPLGSSGSGGTTMDGREQAYVDAQETIEVIKAISKELNTGLDDESLRLVTALCEYGVQPEALSEAMLRCKR